MEKEIFDKILDKYGVPENKRDIYYDQFHKYCEGRNLDEDKLTSLIERAAERGPFNTRAP